MSIPPSPIAPAAITRQARVLGRLTSLLVAGTLALLAWPVGLSIWLGRPSGSWAIWAELAAPVVYLFGLWQLRRAFAAIASGELFGPTTRRALSRLGAAMIVGAALQVVVLPNLVFWLGGGGEGGGLLRFDVAAFSVGAIGAGLLLIARLVDAAGAMAAELDGIL